MKSPIFPKYPPALDDTQTSYLLTNIKDWSIAHGLAVRPQSAFISATVDPSGVLATTAPVTIFPSLFPRSCFEQGRSIQTAYNRLYSAIARDEDWLGSIVQELVGIDDFITKLWEVHMTVKQEGYTQSLTLGLFRSDYMVHVEELENSRNVGLKQVEFNTIASSFGGLSSKVSTLHRYLLRTGAYPANKDGSSFTESSIPQSQAIASLTRGLVAAHTAYGPSKSDKNLCIIFLVQEPERNVFDQRHLEYELLEAHGVRAFRLPFARVLEETHLNDDKTLLYTSPHASDIQWEVTTVYLRAGYSPDDYLSGTEWDARLHLERSRAIKCPSILTHLAGCKKVQQVLATPHSPHLERFALKDDIPRLLDTFAPIYPLDKSQAGLEARSLALNTERAQRLVLKPQREGGGNNVYRKAIPEFLKGIPESHWPAHILMEMIEPPPQDNIIIRNGELQRGGVICELGVYGVCLWESSTDEEPKGRVLENWEAGYLLRTKGDQSGEGGVAAGFGAVDSCCLVDV
ncbi:glutathione synthetase large chain [Pseudovirgaria hyperparasitica]|uniref:Glutathione synthetase n=1 Tax=Pseudovirgaria hyperparasitica TaxID=470096 RepID=A0A6A6W1M4_9PEZI|nr:glutathione synthetase large chain [Pseudovirgaria hyperparasitica]KAF2755894.1 glutathione synthetase large chain [Pseudovirgaria hyperparasitica]